MKQDQKPTMSVPKAGQYFFGLARNASYAAAARGELPTIRVGGRIFVKVAALEKMLAEADRGPATSPRPFRERTDRVQRDQVGAHKPHEPAAISPRRRASRTVSSLRTSSSDKFAHRDEG